MARKIRLLIADDSTVVRRIIEQVVRQFGEIELCYKAKNGSEAVSQIPVQKPDVVLLDVEMPVMNGLEACEAINKIAPTLPIIMFSSLTKSGADTTIKALTNGACDYEAKPSMAGHIDNARQYLVDRLVPKIISWGRRKQKKDKSQFSRTRTAPKPVASKPQKSQNDEKGTEEFVPSLNSSDVKTRPQVLAIGSSTGGPRALREFLKVIPKDFPIPVLIAQHMPPIFTSSMAEQLDLECSLKVVEAKAGMFIERGKVLVAPGDYHMEIARMGGRYAVELTQTPPVNFCRPAVDVLFNSLAGTYGSSTLAVVLTGMGKDGLDGARKLHQRGCAILAQDKESSAVWGMPGEISKANLARCVLPPNELAENVVHVVQPQSAIQPSSK